MRNFVNTVKNSQLGKPTNVDKHKHRILFTPFSSNNLYYFFFAIINLPFLLSILNFQLLQKLINLLATDFFFFKF